MSEKSTAASLVAPTVVRAGATADGELPRESASLALAQSALATDPLDAHVVECAAQLFLEHGIEGVRMTDVAQAAGVGVATLYRHFSTKGRIAAAAGTLMWKRFNLRIMQLVESDSFLALDGYGRLSRLYGAYCQAYVDERAFVAFLDEFDHLSSSGAIERDDLEAYGQAVGSFYVMFDDCYLLGRQDGSIRREVDFPVFYRAVAHALMGVAEKLVRGEIIPSDDFSHGGEELACLVEGMLLSLRVSSDHQDLRHKAAKTAGV